MGAQKFATRKVSDEFIGAWKLVSYERRTAAGELTYPMGPNPVGRLAYDPMGRMSAQLMRPGRAKFASGDWFKGTDDEIKGEAGGYIAYSGPFHTDEEKQTLTHSMFVSLFPNWLGQTQPRVVKIEGDMLHLSTAAPIKSGGKETNSYLTWKRAEPNN